ncbi:MAG: PEP-CTERM sorting domain-containing protein [Phycisphaerae bacterium]|nr:PEP-CTERM sorting domain-containing protein [Phycisphaerae bacterium]
MLYRKISNCVLALCFLGVMSSSAAAVDFLSFNYGNLDGGFNSGSLLFTAVDDADANGNVSRIIAPSGNALFAGTVPASGFPGAAAFGLSMNLSAVTSMSANGSGSLTLTDIDGDTFTATIMGTWTNTGGSATFNGLLTNVIPTNSSTDGTFDGNSGAGFSMTFPSAPPYMGASVVLGFGNWFTDGQGVAQSFSGATTLASGAIVPEPATLGLLGVGALALVVRSRNRKK